MKNYQIILRNILRHLTDSEKNFLMESINEEVKRLRKDIIPEGEKQPRRLFYINRDFYDESSENLRALDVIKDPIALESPLQSLNYLINNIIPLDKEKVLALRFLSKSFKAETGEADLIVKKIDDIIFKISDNTSYTAEILSLLIEINYGSQTTSGIKHFEASDKFVLELRRIYRKYNFRYPIEDVKLINKQLLRIVNSEIRKSCRENFENKILLEDLKSEIENNLN
jgi:hypothetical protein